MSDEYGWDEDEAEADPTPAERLFYALGQLYRRWHRGELPVAPRDFDVLELARTIGLSRDIEIVSEERCGTAYHFEGEVLVVLPDCFPGGERFPWVIWTTEHWAFYLELEEFAGGFWSGPLRHTG